MKTKTEAAKHTPGPWTVDGVRIWADGIQLGVPSKSLTRDEQQANARLIAAAPDLLKALSGIARLKPYGAGANDCPPDGDDAMRVLNYWIMKARAAIDRAARGS